MKQIEMKKNTLYAIATLLTLSLFFVACNDDDLVNGPAPKEGDCIKFSVGGKNSRTVYNESDPWQIDWLQDGTDKIRIYSAEARIGDGTNNVYADYSVTPYATEVSGQTINGQTIANYVSYKNGWLKPNSSGLEWGAADPHNFYAVYPADDSKLAGYDYKNGIITFNYNSNQICTLTGSSKTENGITVYTTNPDMSNAYMVAKASASKSNTYNEENPIELQFEPIMSTLEVTVRGTDQEAIPVQITGVSIICEFDKERTVVSNGQFKYDIDFGIDDYQNQDKYPYANGGVVTGSNGVMTLTTYVGITDGTNNFIKLSGPNQAVKITAFVPPIVLQSDYTTIQVHYSGDFTTDTNGNMIGGNGVLKTCLSKDGKKPTPDNTDNTILVPAGNKRRITLPVIKTPLTNAWLTPLDDDIYVSQLSIPGAHDAATVECGLSQGRCQLLSIPQLLDMGVRVFDLRPTVATRLGLGFTATGLGEIYHGIASTDETMNSVMGYFDEYLNKHDGEFVIILMRNESKDRYLINSFDSEYLQYMKEFLTTNSIYKNRKVAFRKDLTIGDMRGKILIISRNDLTPNSTYETAYTGWNHSKDGGYHTLTGSNAQYQANVYVQDVFSKNEAGVSSDDEYLTIKYNAVKSMMDISAQFHMDTNYTNTWMINHCSGYTSSAISINSYAANAESTNLKTYNYLIGNEKVIGSTGIVMLDYIGGRTTEVGNILEINKTVYGDLLPQAIIDNNYKYHLKRKSE